MCGAYFPAVDDVPVYATSRAPCWACSAGKTESAALSLTRLFAVLDEMCSDASLDHSRCSLRMAVPRSCEAADCRLSSHIVDPSSKPSTSRVPAQTFLESTSPSLFSSESSIASFSPWFINVLLVPWAIKSTKLATLSLSMNHCVPSCRPTHPWLRAPNKQTNTKRTSAAYLGLVPRERFPTSTASHSSAADEVE